MKTLLLHSCCAVCTIGALHALKNQNTEYDITLYFCNDNIDNKDEFERRLPFSTQNAQRTTNNDFDAISPKMITEPYSPNNFFGIAKELGQEKEGGERCKKCFQLRLEKTFKKAKELGFDFFSTTLPISPHKNSKIIFEIGEKLSTINSGAMNPKFVPIDFKKNNGFGKAIELSKKMELYRQNYCGCEFSKRRH